MFASSSPGSDIYFYDVRFIFFSKFCDVFLVLLTIYIQNIFDSQ